MDNKLMKEFQGVLKWVSVKIYIQNKFFSMNFDLWISLNSNISFYLSFYYACQIANIFCNYLIKSSVKLKKQTFKNN